ncbi:MAG TPA: hypothetical protein VK625_05395 [Flavitalea sp.]|nr:hypothetical protein [Flavitalea sp.]
MKRYLFLIVLGLGINTISFAQKEEKEGKKDEAPQALKASLLKTFPGSSHIKWEKEGANYEAEFTHSRKKMSAVYDTKGILLGNRNWYEAGGTSFSYIAICER